MLPIGLSTPQSASSANAKRVVITATSATSSPQPKSPKRNSCVYTKNRATNHGSPFRLNPTFSASSSSSYKTTSRLAEALWDHFSGDPLELSFKAGDKLLILDASDSDWWFGTKLVDAGGGIGRGFSSSSSTSTPIGGRSRSTTESVVNFRPTQMRSSAAGWIPADRVAICTLTEFTGANSQHLVHVASNASASASASSKGRSSSDEDRCLENALKVRSSEAPHHHRSFSGLQTVDESSQNESSHPMSGVPGASEGGDLVSDELSNTFNIIHIPITDPKSPSTKRLERMRVAVLDELLRVERDFSATLEDLVEGYLRPCRLRADLFDVATVDAIFGNIEDIAKFQKGFVAELEEAVGGGGGGGGKEKDAQSSMISKDGEVIRKTSVNSKTSNISFSSRIGQVFLKNKVGFQVYSDYCYNHHNATVAFISLTTSKYGNDVAKAVAESEVRSSNQYRIFFEACRLLRRMMPISLEGFLLTPIQRICKYPLQLTELLKQTPEAHPDFEDVSKALTAMKEIARTINTRKSRVEGLERLVKMQETFDEWKGKEIVDQSSVLLHEGEAWRILESGHVKQVQIVFKLQRGSSCLLSRDYLKRSFKGFLVHYF